MLVGLWREGGRRGEAGGEGREGRGMQGALSSQGVFTLSCQPTHGVEVICSCQLLIGLSGEKRGGGWGGGALSSPHGVK